MYHFMKENAVEKAKDRALKKLREGWRDSLARRWSLARQMIEQADFFEGSSPLAWPVWWEHGGRK